MYKISWQTKRGFNFSNEVETEKEFEDLLDAVIHLVRIGYIVSYKTEFKPKEKS